MGQYAHGHTDQRQLSHMLRGMIHRLSVCQSRATCEACFYCYTVNSKHGQSILAKQRQPCTVSAKAMGIVKLKVEDEAGR